MKKEKMPVRGVVSTVITPFTEDNRIDFEDLAKEINLGSDSGIFGFLCPCGAMESRWMNEEEKSAMVVETVRAAAGRTNIISGVMAYEHDLRMKQCEEYMNAGVDALCLNLPYREDFTVDDYLQAVADLDSFKPKFVLLQDSGIGNDGLPLEYLVRAFEEYETVRAAKIEVQNSEAKYTRVIEATGGRMNIWGGFGNPASIEAYDRGVIGMMPSGLFRIYQTINDLYFEKGRDAAYRFFDAAAPILLQIYAGARLGHYFHKEYFKRLGIFKTTVMRQPSYLDSYRLRICNEIVDKALALESRIDEFWE